MAGIAQKKHKPYFHCGPSKESGCENQTIKNKKIIKINKFISYLP